MHFECLGSMFCVQHQFMNHSSHNKNVRISHNFLQRYGIYLVKYVVETMVSMFRLKCLVEYSNMGNPKLIHSLTARMKGGFPILLEKKKVD